MASTGTDALDTIADLLGECLRDTSVAESLARDWRDQLTARHRAKADGIVVTVISVAFANETGWLTLIRENGMYRVIFWAPELRVPQNKARAVIEAIQQCLQPVIPRERMQVRGIAPYEWLAQKGWKPAEIKRIRAA